MSEAGYTAIVTGTSSGIGLDVAKAMLARGWRVVGIAQGKADLADPRFEQVEVDLLDEAATAAAAQEIAARHEATHLVHNAGL
ncbi:MAG TPA: SDR family NAD(P)-dependent oxidoreductase, partial [Hyphomicrobiales bacterium]|nr:SDR family NAD(P)-dependent oxidoreductase [Hyphomicrobiales bacterium]